jgi:hypothetical protein
MKREKEIIKVLWNEMSFIGMKLVYTVSNIWSLVNRDIKLLLRLA